MSKKKPNKKKRAKSSVSGLNKPKKQPKTPIYTTGFWKNNLIAGAILLLIPFVLYFKCISFGYVLDDAIVITQNNFTQKGFSGIPDLLTTESMTGYFGEQKNLVQGNRYRPLSLVTFATEQGLWGQKPGISHFINILLYAFTCLLLFRVLSLFFRNLKYSKWWMGLAFATALIYMVHPLHSEAVANIKGRDEIMAFLFSLATIYAVFRYLDNRSIKWLGTAGIVFFLGLLSKENAITFLAVIPLSVYFFTKGKGKENFIATATLLGVTILYLILRFSVSGVPELGKESQDLMNNPFLGMTSGERGATIMYILGKYVGLSVFPHPLSHDYYPYAIPKMMWSNAGTLLSLLLYVVMGLLALIGFRKKRIYSYAIFFYLITLTIVSNVVINLGTFMNERFLFISSAGICILMAWILIEKLAKWKANLGRNAALAILGIIVLGYGTKTFLRVPAWESALSLNKSAVAISSNSARANSFMGTALFNEVKTESDPTRKKELLDEAEIYVDKAIRIFPGYRNGNLMKTGIVSERWKLDRDQTALLAGFKDIMRRRPDVSFLTEFLEYVNPRSNDNDELITFYQEVGAMLMNEYSRSNWAAHYLKMGYELDPTNKQTLQLLSQAYQRVGDQQNFNKYQTLLNQLN